MRLTFFLHYVVPFTWSYMYIIYDTTGIWKSWQKLRIDLLELERAWGRKKSSEVQNELRGLEDVLKWQKEEALTDMPAKYICIFLDGFP